jgi:glycosyltransferase involved in cell wall biosynthesis
MSPVPHVSVVIPIKGRIPLFVVTADSLRQQSMTDWEAIVVDDGSEADELAHIVDTIGTDPRFRLIRNPGPHSGACACRNAGFAAAIGQYIVFLDSDDALAPDCLAFRTAYLSTHPELDFAVFLLWNFRDQPGDSTALWNVFDDTDDIERFFAGDAPWQTSCPIWQRTALERLGGWDVRVRNWQDGDFHLRALINGFNYAKVPRPDAFWRMSDSAGSISSKSGKSINVINRIRMIGRMGELLRARGGLTERRRRTISGQFYRHAFRTRLARRRALKVWALGRRLALVNRREFWCALLMESAERGIRQLARRVVRILYPEIECPARYGVYHHPIRTPDSPPSRSPVQ